MKKVNVRKFTKLNTTFDVTQVLNIVAAEQNKFVYEVLREVVLQKYPEYFERIENQNISTC